ncbi:MAG: 50S ribosomal protein L32e [Candidatus Bathyarchaeota archaeon]|nr:MAG: 50S ribosomal protein L32e [Candidatus Bathyarchaeota archaeon]
MSGEKKSEKINNKDSVHTETRSLLRARKLLKSKKPEFVRQESWRYKRVKSSWRKPKGIDSKMRIKKKGWPKSIQIGYRSPKKVRGFHPSGFKEIIIHNVDDLERVNSGNVVRIGGTVGMKKKLNIIMRAKELKIQIVNPRGVEEIEPSK